MTIVIPRPPFDSGIDVVLGGARAAELDIQRKLTHAFIQSNPIQLVLTPYSRTATATGGRTMTAGAARAVQTFRILEVTTMSGGVIPVATQDGVERKVAFQLLGEYDAVVAAHDRFTYSGDTWEVIELMPDLQYEVRAMVVRHGR